MARGDALEIYRCGIYRKTLRRQSRLQLVTVLSSMDPPSPRSFALLLGYSRIPYAAAINGHFFKIFARLASQGNSPMYRCS